ncbi:transglycosylase SLT domain-containing protein [Nocardia sp. NPDC049220]|uniref:aggregation-promoting factor C-terminal-like domain-containing protein n=1 Tax=Nocardia sp. NPDC049220 TaxID=3155273 RepID=UPI0033C4DA0E
MAVATPEIYGGPPTVDTVSTRVPLERTVGSIAIIPLALRGIALTIVPLHQFDSFDKVITHESSWNVFATNPDSGAYGLGQALPPEKMATHGVDWRFNPVTQIRWTYDYMNRRYGGPDGAWKFWQANHWY